MWYIQHMKDFDEKIVFRDWDTYDLYEDVQVDKYALDLEAERQPHLMQKWLDLLTQAQAELSRSKEVMNNIDAKLFLQAKTEGVPELGQKPTEATVKAWVHSQPDYKKAQRRKRKAENDVQYLQNARSILEHRKAMIKVESDLWICGYFAKPLVSGGLKEQLNEERKQQHATKLENSLNKRRRRQSEENGDNNG